MRSADRSGGRSRCRRRRGRASGGRRRRSRGAQIPCPRLHLMITAVTIDFDRGGFGFDVGQRRQRTCACRERGDKDAGSRCCSRRRRARSRPPSKLTSGARRSRAVSSMIRMTRSGAACSRQRVPDAECVERGDRAGEQRSGAVVRRRVALGDQRCFDASDGERDRRGQARRTCRRRWPLRWSNFSSASRVARDDVVSVVSR